MSTEAATVEATDSGAYGCAVLWAGAQHEAGFYLDVPAADLVVAYVRKLTRGTPVEETLGKIAEHEKWNAAEKRRRDEEAERVRVAYETEPAAPEVAPYDERIDDADREHEIARDAFLTARSAGDETDVIVLRVRAHETYRALKRAKYERAAARGVYTSVVTEWIRRDELDRHAERVRSFMLSFLLSDEIALRYDEAPTFSAMVFAYRDAATKLRDELERNRGRDFQAAPHHQAEDATRAQSTARLHEHRSATRAVRPCTVRHRGSRRVTTTGPPDDGGGESEPPSERRRAGALHQDDRRNRAGREWCAGLTGELHLGGSQLHQAAHDVRPTQQDFTTTPHGAPARGSYRDGLTRRGAADPEMKRAPGGNPELVARTAIRARSGVDIRTLARIARPGKELVHELDGRRVPA